MVTQTKSEKDPLDELLAPPKPSVKLAIPPGQSQEDLRSKYAGGQDASYKYWVGVLRECPVPTVFIHGVGFPKTTELLEPDDIVVGKMNRIPQFGGIVILNAADILRMRRQLQRVIVRFHAEQKEEPGTGRNIGAPFRPARRGRIITIPSDKTIEAKRRAGLPVNYYGFQAGDEPVANFLFAQICEDQDNPSCGSRYPDPISITGIEWPHPLPSEEQVAKDELEIEKRRQNSIPKR